MFALGGFTELEGRIMNSMHLHYFSYRVAISVGDRALAISGSLFNIKLYYFKKTIDLLQPLEMFGPDILFL